MIYCLAVDVDDIVVSAREAKENKYCATYFTDEIYFANPTQLLH